MKGKSPRTLNLSRRDAVRLLGLGAGFAFFDGIDLGAFAQGAGAPKAVTFPKGAIIRTVLKDIDPTTLTTVNHPHPSALSSPSNVAPHSHALSQQPSRARDPPALGRYA